MTYKFTCTKVQRATCIVVTLMWAWALLSHFQVLYVLCKALSGELSCMGTGLVYIFGVRYSGINTMLLYCRLSDW